MDYYDLGTYSRKVTTSSPTAQLWFDQGLVWLYAYNHEEAIVCFQKALEADPECAMAYWGIAYGIGPNYYNSWEDFEDDEKPDALTQARDAIAEATQLKDKVTPAEKASRSTARAWPAGTLLFSAWSRMSEPIRRISSLRRPWAVLSWSERSELLQTSSANWSVR